MADTPLTPDPHTADTSPSIPTVNMKLPAQPQGPDDLDDLMSPEDRKLIDEGAEIMLRKEDDSLEGHIQNDIDTLINSLDSQIPTNNELGALFNSINLLPPSEAVTREITRKLMMLLNKLFEKDPKIAKIFLNTFANFLSANPSLGFMILATSRAGGFNPEINPLVIRALTLEFLTGVNDNSVPIEANLQQTVADTLFDMLNSDFGNDQTLFTVVLASLYTNYLSTLPFADSYDHDQRLTALRETFERLHNWGSDTLINNFRQIVERYYPEEAQEVFGAKDELSTSLETFSNETLDDATRLEALNNLMSALFLKKSLNEFEKKFYSEVLRVVVDVYAHCDFADAAEMSAGSLERSVLENVLRLKSELQDSTSVIAGVYESTLVLTQIDSKISSTLQMIVGRTTLNDGLESFYNIFLESASLYGQLGHDLRLVLIESIYSSISSDSIGSVLLIKLEIFLDKIDGTAVANIIDKTGFDNIGQHRNAIENLMYGELIVFILDRPENELVTFIDDALYTQQLVDIVVLIYTIRPEIQQKVEEKNVESTNQRIADVTKPITEVSASLEAALDLDKKDLKDEAIEKKQQNLNLFSKQLHSVKRFGIGETFRERWLKKIDSEVDKEAEMSKEKQLLVAYVNGLKALEDVLLNRMFSAGRNNQAYLYVALVEPEFKESFDTLVINLADCENPTLRNRINRLLKDMACNEDLINLLPRNVLTRVSETWLSSVNDFEDAIEGEYADKTLEFENIKEGLPYKLAPLRKFSKKANAENSLGELYESINKPRAVVIRDMVTIWSKPQLLETFIANPEFKQMLRELLETMISSDKDGLTGLEQQFISIFFSKIHNKEVWNMIPAEIRRYPAELLIKKSLESDSLDYIHVISQSIKVNPSGVPPYDQDAVSDYFAASYFNIIDKDVALKAKVDQIRHQLVIFESAASKKRKLVKGFRRGLTQEEKQLEASLTEEQKEALVQFRIFNEYFGMFASRPGAKAKVLEIEGEVRDSKRDTQYVEQETTLLTNTVSTLNAVQLPDVDTLFISSDPANKTLMTDYIAKSITFIDATKLLTPPIPPFLLDNLEDDQLEAIEVIFENIIKAYYFEVHLNGDKPGAVALTKLKNFIGGFLFNLQKFDYPDLYNSLMERMGEIEDVMFTRSETNFNGQPQTVTHLDTVVDLTNVHYEWALDSIEDINITASSDNASRRKISSQIIQLQEGLSGDPAEVNKILARMISTADGKNKLESLLGNLYFLMYSFRKYTPIVKQIEVLITLITNNLKAGDIKANNILTVAKPRVETAKANTRNPKIIPITTADVQTRMDNAEALIKKIA